MEFKQLRHFVAVVDSGTLSGASEVLHITQPALTRSIKNLEANLEAQLLERGSRGIAPTEAGTRLYHEAKMILTKRPAPPMMSRRRPKAFWDLSTSGSPRCLPGRPWPQC